MSHVDSASSSITTKTRRDRQALTRERHGNKKWHRFQSYAFSSEQILAPLSALEVAKAALSLPLAFAKLGEAWRFFAVLGLVPGQNLFVAPNGQWQAGYVPASLRSYPFCMGRAEGSDQIILCIDETSNLTEDGSGEALFQPDGTLSKSVAEIWSFMQAVAKGEEQLNMACSKLAEADILEAWPLTLKDGDAERPVEGLYRISEEKLNALSDEAFGALRRAGLVSFCYAQIFSTAHISKFGDLAKIRAEHLRSLEKQRLEATNTANNETSGFGFGESLDIDWSKIGN